MTLLKRCERMTSFAMVIPALYAVGRSHFGVYFGVTYLAKHFSRLTCNRLSGESCLPWNLWERCSESPDPETADILWKAFGACLAVYDVSIFLATAVDVPIPFGHLTVHSCIVPGSYLIGHRTVTSLKFSDRY